VIVPSSVECTCKTFGSLVDGAPDPLAGVVLQALYETEQYFLPWCQVYGPRLAVGRKLDRESPRGTMYFPFSLSI
jgi:hypothetical protein